MKGESYYWLIPGQWVNELHDAVGFQGRLFLTAAEAERKRSCECVFPIKTYYVNTPAHSMSPAVTGTTCDSRLLVVETSVKLSCAHAKCNSHHCLEFSRLGFQFAPLVQTSAA